MRASATVEGLGFPTSTIVCEGFDVQAKVTTAGLGLPNLPTAVAPGHVNLQSVEEIQENIEKILVDQIIKNLTVQPLETGLTSEPEPRDIVFKGTFEEVNSFFCAEEWSDGLPIVPPTAEKVEAFLRFADRPDDVIGILLPDNREATVWNIAVNSYILMGVTF